MSQASSTAITGDVNLNDDKSNSGWLIAVALAALVVVVWFFNRK